MAKKVNQVNNNLEQATGCGYYGNQAYSPFIMFNSANPALLSLNWVNLTNVYKNNGFCKMAVDLPVADAFRNGGFEISSSTLDADEINDLLELMNDNDDIERLKDCLRFGRLYGGSAIIVATNENTELPLSLKLLKDKPIEFIPVDRWQCYAEQGSLQLSNRFVLQDSTVKDGNLQIFDKSKVLLYTGATAPYYLRQQLAGWGMSIFEAIIPNLNQYIKANSVILELLDEAKIDILKIDSLAQTLISAGGTAKIQKRLEIASNNKNYKSMIAMDTMDDYQQKQLSFGSLDKILEKIFMLICSSLRMPFSKVFGKGASGLANNSDIDIENYNAMVDSEIRVPATRILKQMIDIRCWQLFGRKVDDLTITWKPMRVMTEEQEQAIEKQKVDEYLSLLNAGILNKKQVAEKLMNEKILMFSDEEFAQLEETDTFDEEVEKTDNAQGDLKPAKNSFMNNLFRRNRK